MLPFGNSQYIKEETINGFQELTSYLNKFDTIKLITNLTLTFLFYPGGEFKPEYDDIHKWSRWIEFISGYLLSNPYVKKRGKIIDGRDLDELKKRIEKYYMSLTKYILFETLQKKNPEEEKILYHLKIRSLYVRGDTFPNKLIDMAISLYSPHSKYFREKYGFTIEEAFQLYESIKTEYENRINERRFQVKKEAKKLADKQVEDEPKLHSKKTEIELSIFYKLFFGMSDIHLSFTVKEMVKFSNFSHSICCSFLDRLSQEFGYRNPRYPQTFKDPFQAPWDYNTLYERPIVHFGNRYFIPNPILFPIVLYNTFHYDLISDKKYQNQYNDMRGKWLEARTYSALKPLFNSHIIMNPLYPNKEELTDIIVLYDRKIYIIQCKSKGLTFESKIGQDFEKVKDDIKKGIESSFEQAVKARQYLLSSDMPELYYSNHRVSIDTRQVTDVFLISITLGYYQSLITRFANISTTLNFFHENDYPWALSISDLEVITEIIQKPSEFIHYTKQRIKLEKTNFDVSADEIDLLNLYLAQGLNFEKIDFKGIDDVALNGFSTDVEQYFHDKYGLQKNVSLPKRNMAEGFENYLDEIEALDVPYKTDCIDKLLLLDLTKQKAFVENIKKLRTEEIKQKKIKALNLLETDQKFGISFIVINSKNDINNLYRQIFSYSVLRKYEKKYDTWIGLGSDINSNKLVEMAIFLDYPWCKDIKIEKMIKKQKGK